MLMGTFDQTALQSAARALGTRLQAGDVLGLSGAVGAGKTTFTRALAQGLGVDRPDRVCSPTFNLCLVHAGAVPLIHVDLYRLEGEGAHAGFEALGLETLLDMMSEEQGGELELERGVLVIEWIDLLPPSVTSGASGRNVLALRLERPPEAEDLRRLYAEPTSERHAALVSAWQADLGA